MSTTSETGTTGESSAAIGSRRSGATSGTRGERGIDGRLTLGAVGLVGLGVLTLAVLPAAGTDPRMDGRLEPGVSGSFRFSWGAAGDRREITVWYDAPPRIADARVLIVMPGRQRNGEEYRDEWREHARRHGVLVVVPELPDELFPGSSYNTGDLFDGEGILQPRQSWAFATIEPLFDALGHEGVEAPGYYLYGHSAGAQFVHRFVLFEPDARILGAVAANAGWYTAIDEDVDFPYGLDGSPATDDSTRHALGVPLLVLLGEEDDDPDADGLRRTPEAMAQGDTRLERGRSFFDGARTDAERRDAPFRWQLVTVPGADHDNAAMAPTAATLLFGL